MLATHTHQTPQTRDRILATGCAMMAAGGARRMTLRAVAERLGLTGAAVSYHLGSKDGLIAHVTAFARKRIAARLAEEHLLAPSLVSDTSSLANILHAHVVGRSQEERIDNAVMMQAQAEVLFANADIVRPALSAWRTVVIEFWTDILARLGQTSPHAPRAIAAFLEAERRFSAGEPECVTALTIPARCHYFAAKLLGDATPNGSSVNVLQSARALVCQAQNTKTECERTTQTGVETGKAPAPAPDPAAPGFHDSSPVDRILSAALDLIAEEGVATLTHRRIAERADVSLSSTTYHFTSLSQIVIEAFTRLTQDIAFPSGPLQPGEANSITVKPEEFITAMALGGVHRGTATDAPKARANRVISAMTHYAPAVECCRPFLGKLSLQRGEHVHQALQQVVGVCDRVTAMDAHVFDTIADGLAAAQSYADGLVAAQGYADPKANTPAMTDVLRWLLDRILPERPSKRPSQRPADSQADLPAKLRPTPPQNDVPIDHHHGR